MIKKKHAMQPGMVGLGRMGANMALRLIRGDHRCVVFDRSPQQVKDLVKENAVGSASLADLVKKRQNSWPVRLMVPAAVVDTFITDLLSLLSPGEIVINGGNSPYVDNIRRARQLVPNEIHYVDVGTSDGVWGLDRSYCLMIGGVKGVVRNLDPLFAALAPGSGDIARTIGRERIRGAAAQIGCRPLRADGPQRD